MYSQTVTAIMSLVSMVLLQDDGANRFKTLATDYTVTNSIQIDGKEKDPLSTETGRYLYDSGKARAMYSRTSTTSSGEEWRSQDLFDEDTSLSSTWRDHEPADRKPPDGVKNTQPRQQKAVSGRSDRTLADWSTFLGLHALSTVTGHIVLGKEGFQIEELQREIDEGAQQSSSGGIREFVAHGYRIRVSYDSEFDNRISEIRWTEISPDPASDDYARISSGEIVVQQFERIADFWIPVKFVSSVIRSAGVARLPAGLKLGNSTQAAVPSKTFFSEVELTHTQVNIPLSETDFAPVANNGDIVTNWDAPHIRHVLVGNRILPEVDAAAAGLIQQATFASESEGTRSRHTWLIVVNVVVAGVVIAVLAVRRFSGRSKS